MFVSIHSIHPIFWTKWLAISLIFGSLCFSNPGVSAQANTGAINQTGLQVQETSPSTPASNWQIVTIDENAAPLYWYKMSLVMDSSDQPHISYVRRPPNTNINDIEYVYHDASGWHFQQIASDSQGAYTTIGSSMVLDSFDKARIAFYTASFGLMYVQEINNWTWNYEYLDNYGMYPSLKLDSNNNPYISYYNSSGHNLNYAYQDASGWHILTADPDTDVGLYSSLALVEDFYKVIAYYDSTDTDLKYVMCSNFCYTPGTVDSQGGVGEFPSLAISPPFDLHVSYMNHSWGDLIYAFYVYGWTTRIITYPPYHHVISGVTSLAIDSKGYVHIAVDNAISPHEILYFSQGPNNTWHAETVYVTHIAQRRQTIALAIDSHDVPHIAFINDELEGTQPKYRLSYATRLSSVFLPVVVNRH